MSEPVEIIHEGRYLRTVRRGSWEFVQRRNVNGVVGIIAVTDEGRLVLVEQYRAPLDCCAIELPAGLAGDVAGSEGEELAAAACRELEEETGYRAREMRRVAQGTASAGLCDEVVTLFVASGLQKVADGGGDHSENIKVHEVPVGRLLAWLDEKVRSGVRVDLKVYSALAWISPGVSG